MTSEDEFIEDDATIEEDVQEDETLRDVLESAVESSELEESGEAQEEILDEQPEEEREIEAESSSSEKDQDQDQDQEVPELDIDVRSTPKPPASWKATTREKFNALPDDVKAEIHRREVQTSVAIQRGKEGEGFKATLDAIVDPYRPMLQAAGADEFQAIHYMFKTQAVLRTGTPSQKAAVLAEVIKQHAVDIPMLDDLLSGQEPQQGEDVQTRQYIDQQLAPVQQLLQEVQRGKASNQQNQQDRVQTALQKFSSNHEYYQDVREDMADIMEMSANRGVTITLEDAYARACSLNDDISTVLSQRSAAATNAKGQEASKRRRRAAKSLAGRGAGVAVATEGSTLRDTLQEAIDSAGGLG